MKTLFFYLQQALHYRYKSIRLKELPWAELDRGLTNLFLDTSVAEEERYRHLFSYFMWGLQHYRGSNTAHVYYPGALSRQTAAVNAMEGFCRILPMLSAWIGSGRPSIVLTPEGCQVDLLQVAREGILAGTDPESRVYWGVMGDFDQRIVEAADVALGIWLLRKQLWPQLSHGEKQQVAKWLASVHDRAVHDNNWLLFPVLIDEVLAALDCGSNCRSTLAKYERLKTFHRGNGWFSDGPDGVYDYYNAWGIHYSLFWIDQVNPFFDPDFITDSLQQFVHTYLFFFATEGIPITGRSICYRMAAPAPLVAAATRGLEGIAPGLARKALDCTWRSFIKRGAVRRGTITQGYWEENLALLDSYSGPGSALWSTRSLTLAYYNPPQSAFWTSPLEALPIENGDYCVSIPELGWEVRGDKQTGDVQIVKLNNSVKVAPEVQRLSPLFWFLVFVLGLPYREQDRQRQYQLRTYSSLQPFWLTT